MSVKNLNRINQNKPTGNFSPRKELAAPQPQKSQGVNRNNLQIQRKLSIGSSDDPLEHEADAMADTIMRMPQQNFLQRKCAKCKEEDQVLRKPLASFIQKKGSQGGTVASDSVSNKINSSRGKGSPLPNSTKSFMESRFGTEFSNVNIHTGGEAIQLSRDLNAKAFTVGNDIYFNRGAYNPGLVDGKKLLAHELTHTIQQGGTQSKVFNRTHNEVIQRASFWEGVSRFFGGGTFSNEELKEYLDKITRTRKIEDSYDSDNKAREIVKRWKRGDVKLGRKEVKDMASDGTSLLLPFLDVNVKILLIEEMLDGFTGDDDERAILDLLDGSSDDHLSKILDKVGVGRLNNKINFAENDSLTELLNKRRSGLVNTNENVSSQVFDEEKTRDVALQGILNAERPSKDRAKTGEVPRQACIVIIHDVLPSLYNEDERVNKALWRARHKSKSTTVAPKGTEQFTIARLGDELTKLGLASGPIRIKFLPSIGNRSSDKPPNIMEKSAWDAINGMVGDDIGWHIFGLGLFDGNHAISVFVNVRSDGKRHIYMADQWANDPGDWFLNYMEPSSTSGLRQYSKKPDFDGHISKYTERTWLKLNNIGVVNAKGIVTRKPWGCENEGGKIKCKISRGWEGETWIWKFLSSKKVKQQTKNETSSDDSALASNDNTINTGGVLQAKRLSKTNGLGQSGNTVSPEIAKQVQETKGNGHALDANTQSFMESRFGVDFSGVKIHSNDQAAGMSRGINAKAFTIGQDIYFNQRAYNPSSVEGKKLLAHELTHTIQQGEKSTIGTISNENNEIAKTNFIQRDVLAEEQRLQSNDVTEFSNHQHLNTIVQRLQSALATTPSIASAQAVVNWWGYKLWEEARILSNSGETDDRPLYWTRLRMQQIIRNFNPQNRFNISSDQQNQLINGFNQSSRGMPTGGGQLAWIANSKRILISGFDPFHLDNNIRQNNPSGAAALALDGEIIRHTSIVGLVGQIQSVILPVNFDYFDNNRAEGFFRPYIQGPEPVDMIMTISQGSNSFEIEEYASRYRNPNHLDNENESGGSSSIPSNSPQFITSSLPRQRMREEALGRTRPTEKETEFRGIYNGREETQNEHFDPSNLTQARYGSGGDYLSNEIFYRTSLLRISNSNQNQRQIPVGHLHVPRSNNNSNRNSIINRIRQLIRSALEVI